jgi:hypothetical protein
MIDIIKTSSANNNKKSSALLMCIYKRDQQDNSIKTQNTKGYQLNNNALAAYLSPNLLRIERSRHRLFNNKAQKRAKAMI